MVTLTFSVCLTIVSSTISYAFYKIVLYPFYFSPLRHQPGPPLGPNLLIGRFGEILVGETGIPQRKWVKEHGQTIRVVGPLGLERLIFCRPEALHKILAGSCFNYPKPEFLNKVLGTVAGFGLLTTTGAEHKRLRKAMISAFSIQNIVSQIDMYHDAVNGLVDILHDRVLASERNSEARAEDMYLWLTRVTLDIICIAVLGLDVDSLHNPDHPVAVIYEQLVALQSGVYSTLMNIWITIPGFSKLLLSDWFARHSKTIAKIPGLWLPATIANATHEMRRISAANLRKKIVEAEALLDDEGKKDILSLLVRARRAEALKAAPEKTLGPKEEGRSMTDAEVVEQALTFLGAGHETTASGLAWTLWLLANDKTSQTRLREELLPLFERDERGIRRARLTYRNLKDLSWLDCVVNESLRIFPPVPNTLRVAAATDVIEDVVVPKGTLLSIPIRVVNTLKDIWGEDAEEFNPERWLSLPEKYNPTYSLLSFIAGPHSCIGRTMAIMEMKAVIAGLIANFEFEPGYEGQVPHPTTAITMKPRDNMPLRLKRVQ